MLIAQISDTHIVPKGQDWKSLPETEVATRLKRIVEAINSLTPKPDVVLLTGDTIDDGGKEGYDHLKEILKSLSMPLYVIPGNHDDREDMRVAFQHEDYMPRDGFIHYVIDDHPIRLVALDTVIPGETHGLLCQERVDWLGHVLQENREKPTLIFMHHPLIKTGQKILDHVKCFTPDGFEDLIRSFPNIRGIIAGHNHRPCMTLFGGALCFVAPSVAPQFHFFEEEGNTCSAAIELTHPSFSLHKWEGGFQLLSETFQIVEPEQRLSKKKITVEKLRPHPFSKHATGH
ncbi:MAG: phosphodiesterase [Alphaproteobacteria bacterium]|jgi:3',5'-cyclic AMP phosphodiesterase CpdA|nr:phosphodiesterase [Alphaproteobacteria bacterium]MDF3033385.1 phosphodiesterase [Alphaproteobacteria bacterium]